MSEEGKKGSCESERNCVKYLKRRFKMGQGVSALKRLGLEPPYKICGC